MDQVSYIAPEFAGADWRYSVVLNGFIAELTYRHADAVRHIQGVKLVYPEEQLEEEMDGSRSVIGAPIAWQSGGEAAAGLGARVGILESGNAVGHPFLSDTGMPPAPAGYPLARFHLAGGSSGTFPQPAVLTNNKLLAFRLFARSMSDKDRDAFGRGQRVTGHGTHVAGIISGRSGSYEIHPGWAAGMSGVAPMSTLFSYPILGGTPEMVAALDVAAAEDKLDVMNISMGTATWLLDTPDAHPLSLAAAGAEDAGMVVVTSAGNTGDWYPNSLTGSWKYSEHVLAVANSSSAARSGVTVSVDQEGVPAQLPAMRAGVLTPSTSVTRAPASFVEDACNPQVGLAGRIAVVEMVTERNVINTYCGLQQSSQHMRDAGALAILYLYRSDLVGQHGLQGLPPVWSPVLASFTLGYADSRILMDYMADHLEPTVTIDIDVQRSLDATVDVMYGDSSIGPGLDGSIKPDLSAPGINILSSTVREPGDSGSQDSPAPLWSELSGTSMAAAHVSGAVALLRSQHPSWTAPQLRAALLLTTADSLRRGLPAALISVAPDHGGVGRLDIGRAINPGILLTPPKASFGNLAKGSKAEMTIFANAISGETTRWKVSVIPGTGQGAPIIIEPQFVTVGPSQPVSFKVLLDSAAITNTHAYGTILLTESDQPLQSPRVYLPSVLATSLGSTGVSVAGSALTGGIAERPRSECCPEAAPWTPRILRLAYSAFVEIPQVHRDVLLIDWTPDRPSEHHHVYEQALADLGLSFTDWWIGSSQWGASRPNHGDHPPLEDLRNHDLIIINTNESRKTVGFPYSFRFYQQINHLLSGGNLLITGQGELNFWRSLDSIRYRINGPQRVAYPETFPRVWNTPGKGFSCDMCLTRYFAGFTPELTATLSGRLLLPFGTQPDRPNALVLLQPHPEADPDSPFAQYSVDISTGTMAVGGAAGNQYTFASGDVMREYRPTAPDDPDTPVDESMLAANLGDVDDAAWTRVPGGRGRLIPGYARPLWTYPVNGQPKVVGTYIAGKHHPESRIPWNAMFWGFGLEGVGKSHDDTVTPEQLLGDAFNFLARNVRPQGVLSKDATGRPTLSVSLGNTAAPLRFVKAEVDWLGGFPQTYTFDPPRAVQDISLEPDPAVDPADLAAPVPVTLYPIRGSAAPIHLRVR
ncbi:MAG: S8 family serine peptidase [Ardenticatenia bacterium]|nr:S8 family serine peptidase [Ardenticatenia bacterium]